MNDLHKYLIGTAAGVILCLLIWGGYSMFAGKKEQPNALAAIADRGNTAASLGLSSDILGGGNVPNEESVNSGDLTAEQQERLFAAQVANESLTKQYNGDASSSGSLSQGSSTGSFTDAPLADAFAMNRGVRERAAQGSKEQITEAQRSQISDAIIQGKSAAQKNQLANTLSAFEDAEAAMPDDKDLQATSYQDMAASLFLLSKTAPDEQTAQAARDEAERYIKKSLAARNNTDARGLYSNIIEEQRKAADAKRQQTMMAQQEAVERAQKEKLAEQQRRQVVELIGQGKNAVNNRQMETAVSSFDRAAVVMPDIKQFASDSLTEMADAMLTLSQRVSSPADVQTSLNKAEDYVKQSLAVQNTAGARSVYAKILEARKEQEQLAQRQADEQRRQLEQEQIARAKADAQRREQERKAEEQRKEQERLAQARAETQRKQHAQAQAAEAAAQRKAQEQQAQRRADEQRKQREQEQIARAQVETQREQQTQAAEANTNQATQSAAAQQAVNRTNQMANAVQKDTAAAPKKLDSQEKAKTPAHKQVEKLLMQGETSAQRKQLNNTILTFDRAGRLMPKDNDFAAESFSKMAETMLELEENSGSKQGKQNALKKASEYIKKSLAAKDTPEGQTLAAKIAEAQAALQGNNMARAQTAPQKTGNTANQAALRRQRNAADRNTANTSDEAAVQQGSSADLGNEASSTERDTAGGRNVTAAAPKAQAELQSKKREIDALVQQGKKSGANGNFADAQNSFNKAAAAMPDGDKAFAAEQYREMADTMQELSKTVPAQKNAALNSALGYIKKSIAAKNDDGKAHFVYAQIADGQNNASLAVQELEAARRLDPQNYRYNYELGRKYFEQKKYPQARTCFEQAVKSNPQYEAAFFNLGITHKIMNANDAALTAFSKAAALKPDYVRAWIEVARIQDKKHSYTDAIENYQKALSMEPSNLSAIKEMAQVYSKMKDAKQAERYFKEALTLGDTDPVTYYNLASVQLEAGKAADALQNAEKAVAGNSRDARFLYAYALALEKNNRLPDAEDYYARSVAADGKYGKPRINLGRIQLEAGNLENAEQHLLAASRAEPSNFEVNINLGKLYGLKNEYGKAIDYYASAIKIMPKDIDARQSLAAVYLSAGLKENARDTYQALLKINPQAWDSYYELGKVYISMGNKAEAKTVFEKLLKQKPNYRAAAEIRKLLGSL